MSLSPGLEGENKRLRQQLVNVTAAVMGGCTGVTVASNDGLAKPPRGSKLTLRCQLYERLAAVLKEESEKELKP